MAGGGDSNVVGPHVHVHNVRLVSRRLNDFPAGL